jgi:hypothetical protein
MASPVQSYYSLSFFQKIRPLQPILFFITTNERAMFLLTYAHLLDNEQAIPFVYCLKRPFCIRRIRCISRRALSEPAESPFMKLYQSGCLQSMITYTEFDFQAFSILLQLFEPKFNQLVLGVGGGRLRQSNVLDCFLLGHALEVSSCYFLSFVILHSLYFNFL